MNRIIFILALSGLLMNVQAQQSKTEGDNQMQTTKKSEKPHVLIVTSMGDIEIELYPDKAPVSVKNFLSYVNDKFYDHTIFHRVINNFMIQGGGFTADLSPKPTKPPIPYEGNNGLSNERGTIAYARTADPNSATSQFFINQRDNFGLDHGKTADGYGYTVFGKVVRGMAVVDKIAAVKTGSRPNGMQDVPVKPVTIESIRLLDDK